MIELALIQFRQFNLTADFVSGNEFGVHGIWVGLGEAGGSDPCRVYLENREAKMISAFSTPIGA